MTTTQESSIPSRASVVAAAATSTETDGGQLGSDLEDAGEDIADRGQRLVDTVRGIGRLFGDDEPRNERPRTPRVDGDSGGDDQPERAPQPVPKGLTAPQWDEAVDACQEAHGKSEEECRELPVFVVDGKRKPKIAINDASAIARGKPWLLNTMRDKDAAELNREFAGCKAVWAGPDSCDEYPFASTYQGGLGAQVMGVPKWENDQQGRDMSAFLRRNRMKRGDPFLVWTINVSQQNGNWVAG
ncbi:hypothetical protein H1V43_08045 [Streptomyces sp. PSKA54]|uniref:Deoxyribonuclease NucA/NucB domain-containing protein n=1 Tax=Streptomyces himalayensis subsp. aureolus TaxID=2758039 RepID=A0A7W2CYR1_9ACTN|nr:NucA/NucB deoxyribonuclease domain-containing protein [Streptomyces himalayensis]MBA4861340.1 hypothetical protein [Streptomyces himalayensis subsp. aureolus]